MKEILVIAKYEQAEAMRVAAGLTLLNDRVRVVAVGQLSDDPAVLEQKEVLDFAEVPYECVDAEALPKRIAKQILAADVVFLL